MDDHAPLIDFSVTIEVLRTLAAIFDAVGDAQQVGADDVAATLISFADKLAGQFLNPMLVREN